MNKHPKAGRREKSEESGNPFTLIPKLYRAGKTDEMLDVLTGIYYYLRRKQPSRVLRSGWKRELGGENCSGGDFLMVCDGRRHTHGYFIRLRIDAHGPRYDDCYLDYDNGNLAISADGHKSLVARRARQLLGGI